MSSNHNKLISICYGQYAFITINELKIELLLVGVMIRENITSHKLFITFQNKPLRAFIYSQILTFPKTTQYFHFLPNELVTIYWKSLSYKSICKLPTLPPKHTQKHARAWEGWLRRPGAARSHGLVVFFVWFVLCFSSTMIYDGYDYSG